jgi:serine/threonine protein kinase
MGVASGAGRTATDRFHVIGRLGEGGMGVVHRALDLVLGVEVAIAHLAGRADDSRALGARAIAAAQACDLGLHAQAARWRHGERTGDAELVADAETWMRARKIVDPARLVRVLAV